MRRARGSRGTDFLYGAPLSHRRKGNNPHGIYPLVDRLSKIPFLPGMPSISISRESETRVKADITVNSEEMKPAEEQALKKIGAQAEIKGFRNGKAPAHLIKAKFASDIRLETLFGLVDQHIGDVEKKIEERVYRLVRIEDVQEKGD